MEPAHRGTKALEQGDFQTAIALLTEAIGRNPRALDSYVKRSIAYSRTTPPAFDLALKDAEIACVLADERAKRELIAAAQLRRAVALYGLQKWAEAEQCLQWVQKYDPKEKSLAMWQAKVGMKTKALSVEEKKIGVPEVPLVKINDPIPAPATQEPKAKDSTEPSSQVAPQAQKTTTTQTPANLIRHEWYQSNSQVIVTLFAKGIPKDKISVDIKELSLDVTFPLANASEYNFSLDPLCHSIDASNSEFRVMSTKAEFYLHKVIAGQKWKTLEATSDVTSANTANSSNSAQSLSTAPAGPAYPTSSKGGPKNWDKLASELTRKTAKTKDSADADEGLADNEEEGDPVNNFFKTLYKDADPDTRRAMMKSYQESNGTALSTNWSEVKKGKVETSPPDGMEAKKWS